jgi:acyl-CoA thioesterase
MPVAPGPEHLEAFFPPNNVGQRTDMRAVHGFPPFARPDTSSLHWTRETSGRSVDYVQLTFLADSYPPRSWYWSEERQPSATITLSVYFHATATEMAAVGDDYVLIEATGTRGADSTSGQQARLWSRRGELLATTEQLAWYR